MVSVREGEGQVRVGRYTHRYHAALGVASEARRRMDSGTPAHEIAVLTRNWDHLNEVQHALREARVPYQLYNVHDQLRPTGSLIGHRVREALALRPEVPVPEAHAALEALRLQLGLSDRDRAWGALLAATEGLTGLTQGALALRLDAARPITRDGVVLSTFHSAKGSEFDHVFVLSEGMRSHGWTPPADDTRALYVALTRARESVTLLRREGDCHPTLLDPLYQQALKTLGAESLAVPTGAPLPSSIRYDLTPDPGDLYVSARVLLVDEGRAAVNAYARDWNELHLDHLQVRSSNGVVAKLTRSGRFTRRLSEAARHGTIQVRGATVVRCERDDEWYTIARYTGSATHHHLVLPEFEVTAPL